MYADVTGKPRLDMREVHSFVESLHQVGGKKKKSEKENFVSKSKKFAPGQLSQMRQVSLPVRAHIFMQLHACTRADILFWHYSACKPSPYVRQWKGT